MPIEFREFSQFSQLFDQIEAYRKATRPDIALEVIAVSKTVKENKITTVLDQKHKHFGENRIQEAELKWPNLRKSYPDTCLHFLGSIQRNKLKKMLGLVDYFHAMDRKVIIEDIAKYKDTGAKMPKLFLQVNIGNEEQKSGCSINDVDHYVKLCRSLFLPIIGLMAIPPHNKPASPYFAELGRLAKENNLNELSMGMTNDWKQAVELGATWLRLGRCIFGNR